jgi:hypothetical protein
VYGIIGRGRHDFRGMTVIDFGFADGLRADINGARVVDRWGAGSPTTFSVQDYLPVLADIRFEKLSTLGQDAFSISWTNICDLFPAIGPAEWWARYYRILYTPNPESWTIDRDDCLGAQLISSDMLIQSGEPPPIAALGLIQLWGAEFFAARTFGANTNVSVTYDDGVRIFDGGSLLYEDWYGPQVETASFVYGAGTHDIRLEYFQNNGGTQIRFQW